MVIRLKKLYALMFVCVLILITFVIALKAEKQIMPASNTVSLQLPIVMYHHVTKNASRAGAYVIKLDEIKKDFEYIKEKGYTPVTVSDLTDYVSGKKMLPSKIIMITFDDGFLSVYNYIWPLLKEMKMKAVASAVGTITDTYTKNNDTNVNYAYMSWDMLSQLAKSDEFEVQNHTYDMHHNKASGRKGLSKMQGESDDQYKNVLRNDLIKMQNALKENSSIHATAAVYPYGVYSSSTLSVVKEVGFKCSMVCEERINTITIGNEDCLYNLGRYNRPSGISSEKFFKKLGIE